ncbi:hypothetical protein THAR02_00255 [Trichoderma harzianum]|uniref:Uncharacterized protein n=1 Tax=Trichoderma harzianum TaxID=5544 RepID=A0A0F9XSV1_TRIHA|nr:hypothetical protein THAR02_00255 [Trichoderma harzianum]
MPLPQRRPLRLRLRLPQLLLPDSDASASVQELKTRHGNGGDNAGAWRAELEQKPKCRHDVSRRGAWLASRLAVAEIIGAAAPAGDSAQG